MKYIFFTLILFQSILGLRAQNAFFKDLTFTRQDSLRGMITEERAWWDLEHYDLQVEVDIDNRIFRGSNKISYEVLKPNQVMQIDLQMPMELTSAMVNGVEQSFEREGNVYFITLQKDQKVSDHNHITVHFEGIPRRAKMPPWDGGISWTTDDNATPFVATSCQGDGASLWWPCKDHMYDEPDSMLISVTVPHNLIDVSNGKLRKIIKHEDEKNTFVWAVVNPINNYGVNVNIADYKHFHENYQGEKGALSCD